MADAPDLKSCVLRDVWVRVPPPLLNMKIQIITWLEHEVIHIPLYPHTEDEPKMVAPSLGSWSSVVEK